MGRKSEILNSGKLKYAMHSKSQNYTNICSTFYFVCMNNVNLMMNSVISNLRDWIHFSKMWNNDAHCIPQNLLKLQVQLQDDDLVELTLPCKTRYKNCRLAQEIADQITLSDKKSSVESHVNSVLLTGM